MQSIYFATLDQYKYNPAVVISGEIGAEVKAAAAGTVSAVDTNAQTGTTVSIDMGNGYAAIYGQLKEVPVQPGEYVAENSVIGYVSEPTKYYSVEGQKFVFPVAERWTASQPDGSYRVRIENGRKRKDPEEKVLDTALGIFFC